jgi:G:T/U-mismatch repair DNA glycosylase
MATLVRHKFSNHKIAPDTETLILGTFNPDTAKNAGTEFFYGSPKNSLWTLLPLTFSEPSLKESSLSAKRDFMHRRKIDFIDLISVVNAADGRAHIRDDSEIDQNVAEWRDVIAEIDKLKCLKRIGFTRSTFGGIPNIKRRLEEIDRHLKGANSSIKLEYLITPVGTGRAAGPEKQKEVWKKFLLS